MRKQVELVCGHCGKTFLKCASEHKRRQKIGKNVFYCSLSCGSKVESVIDRLRPFQGNAGNLDSGNRRDTFTDFRWYLKVINNANRKKKHDDIDLEYLKCLWEQQNGICPISGISMKLRTHNNCKDGLAEPYSASLDRINNDLGYVKGNVRYVCYMANIARSRFSDEQLVEFCKRVNDHNTGD
jgi:hypothetical protein